MTGYRLRLKDGRLCDVTIYVTRADGSAAVASVEETVAFEADGGGSIGFSAACGRYPLRGYAIKPSRAVELLAVEILMEPNVLGSTVAEILPPGHPQPSDAVEIARAEMLVAAVAAVDALSARYESDRADLLRTAGTPGDRANVAANGTVARLTFQSVRAELAKLSTANIPKLAAASARAATLAEIRGILTEDIAQKGRLASSWECDRTVDDGAVAGIRAAIAGCRRALTMIPEK